MLTIAKFTALTRFEQSLYGLPFVLTGALLPFFENFSVPHWGKLLFIIPAFFAARISGMSFNQLIDRNIDVRNPRTKDRPLPSKLVTPRQAQITAISFLVLFLLFALCINFLCFCVGLFAAFLIVLYSFMKRIHYSCHFVMGIIHFLAPIGAFLVVRGEINISIILLSLIPLFSIAAIDIVYALQDLEFDRKEGLHSIPAHFGMEKSLTIAKVCHALAFFLAIAFGISAQLPLIYFLAPAILLYLFISFYKKSKDPSIFFTTTVGTSFSIFLFTLAAFLWHVLL